MSDTTVFEKEEEEEEIKRKKEEEIKRKKEERLKMLIERKKQKEERKKKKSKKKKKKDEYKDEVETNEIRGGTIGEDELEDVEGEIFSPKGKLHNQGPYFHSFSAIRNLYAKPENDSSKIRFVEIRDEYGKKTVD